ncbi:MAG: hypothetical protein UZ01_00066 [Candidatus Brocadia sinica]|uniref:Lipocalin/cytosolic fatty-acid binding domain-containing protein n=1 Tax=Candidatus Brocadia sinica JPN1 TaxID=1197129 RepID=A0ABQ0JVB1_9BACT|nr:MULTISPECIES: hypothetical protein [Brocadia]KXK33480.1 MAG: hypothetical protein UZ01_00066 [Candidatus Brocadia sinica]MCK6468975.1 hypothetical protein [Candidatus Brocadia sinica]GAN32690.1 hypothetical protein BROSI_A1205 [Candidatus Brocadia sinica JPN1]GIK13775.1 MAG: hypothetical protein BroJett002_24820 [Candidatus Brocadia sinica]GJQ16452.1 MAG: hypothetical protein HBSIN01_04110 [Candidatus Brocadia sinica]
MNFIGTWYIYEMEMWDEDYFNMEMMNVTRSVAVAGLELRGKTCWRVKSDFTMEIVPRF